MLFLVQIASETVFFVVLKCGYPILSLEINRSQNKFFSEMLAWKYDSVVAKVQQNVWRTNDVFVNASKWIYSPLHKTCIVTAVIITPTFWIISHHLLSFIIICLLASWLPSFLSSSPLPSQLFLFLFPRILSSYYVSGTI